MTESHEPDEELTLPEMHHHLFVEHGDESQRENMSDAFIALVRAIFLMPGGKKYVPFQMEPDGTMIWVVKTRDEWSDIIHEAADFVLGETSRS